MNRPNHRSKTERRISKVVDSLRRGNGRVHIERPEFSIIRYYLDGQYVVTRGIYQLLCEHGLPGWKGQNG
jgi:hypothetical protein